MTDPEKRERAPDPRWRLAALALSMNLLWGGNLVAVKLGFAAVPPLWSAFCRFALGSATVLPWALLRGESLRPRPDEWRGLAILSAIFTVQISMMNWGTHLTTAGIATTLMATNPLFAGLLAHFFVPGDRLTPRRAAGLAVAFAGVCAIVLTHAATGDGERPLLGNLLVLTSGALLGGRLVFAQRLLQRMAPTRVVFWQMMIALPIFFVAAWITESIDFAAFDMRTAAAIGYQGIVIAGLGFMVAASLLRRYRPSQVVGYNFTAPVFGVLLSLLLLGETPSASLLGGLGAVALGIYLITTGN